MKKETKPVLEDKKVVDVKERRIGASSVKRTLQNGDGRKAKIHEN